MSITLLLFTFGEMVFCEDTADDAVFIILHTSLTYSGCPDVLRILLLLLTEVPEAIGDPTVVIAVVLLLVPALPPPILFNLCFAIIVASALEPPLPSLSMLLE
uniref:Putative secreted peptide n=1 Tax=Anopheles braziliensis TaxID=58242 RepID=A0A2M3ZPR0_9DIPT